MNLTTSEEETTETLSTIIQSKRDISEVETELEQLHHSSQEICYIRNIGSSTFIISSTRNLNVEEFQIRHEKNLELLPENIGAKFPNLKTFDTDNSGIENIKASTFKNLKGLKKLFLGQNKIKTIAAGAFDGLEALEMIQLSENRLEQLDVDIFNGIPNLDSLFLDFNLLTHLDENLLKNLKKLEIIALNNNRLTTLPETFFSKNIRLAIIDLNDNQIETLSPKLFEKNTNLATVNLAGNQCINMRFLSIYFNSYNLFVQVMSDSLKNCAR